MGAYASGCDNAAVSMKNTLIILLESKGIAHRHGDGGE
jgi:hypothetical protein